MAMLKPREMADRLGVTVRTLQEWDRKGIFPEIGRASCRERV